MKVLHTE